MSDEQTAAEIVEKHRNYVDTVSVTVTERAAIRAQSELLSLNIDANDSDDLLCGVTVSQDGTDIALKGGTIPEQNGGLPSLYTWNGLTPAQAREVADGLYAAADEVERLEEEYESEDTEESSENSIIRRILG